MAETINTQAINKSIHTVIGRPISASWRFDDDGNLKIKNPTRRDYNMQYYQDMNVFKATCNSCNRDVVWKHMKRHKETSNICKKLQEQNNGI